MESITKKKNPTFGHCALQRTSLLSGVCGDSYGDWNTREKPAMRNCQPVKKWEYFKRFFISIFLNHLPCTLALHTYMPAHGHDSQTCTITANDGGWWLRQGQRRSLISPVTSATELLLILWEKGHALEFAHTHAYSKKTNKQKNQQQHTRTHSWMKRTFLRVKVETLLFLTRMFIW